VSAGLPEGPRKTVAIVGGGIAGLAAGYELLERSERGGVALDVLCLEAGDRTGGNIRSDRERGFLYEWAANGFLDDAPATLTLVRRLGLEGHVLRAREEAARRFVFRAGKLREIPLTPPAFLTSGVLGPLGKLRVLLEPLVRPRRDGADGADESVFDFAARRIGRRAASVLVDAMVSGVYAGDVRQLSLEATFPKMRRMEEEHGTLFRALQAKRREARAAGTAAGGPAGPGGRLTSFAEGLQELTGALAAKLGDRVRLRTPVERLSDMGNRGFRIHPREGAPLDVHAVVLACPAWTAAPIVAPMDAEMSRALEGIPSASLAVVHLGYRRDAIGGMPPGFGFLVPRGQGPRILGALWASNIFERRAPDGSVLLTVMIGGAHDPQAVSLRDAPLLDIVRGDLRRTMGIQAQPYFVRTIRHPRGIPQYVLGHLERVRTVERRRQAHAGLWITGSSLGGISVNACVEEAARVAESVLEFLSAR
jgi:oxygen-dependent protoporphyrinogen oxidase